MQTIYTNIKDFLLRYKDRKLLIVGVGNLLRGDDAVGLLLAEKINNPKFKVIRAESGLENYIGKIIKIKADVVVIVDAVFFNEKIGAYKIFSSNFVQSNELLSHSLPFNMIKNMIERFTQAKLYFLGIQPKNIQIGTNLSPQINNTLNQLSETINSIP